MARFTFCRIASLSVMGLGAILALSVAGCGDKATVTGKVTIDGAPANAGSVIFSTEKGKSATGDIRSDGTYTVADAPLGAVRISILPMVGMGGGDVTLPAGMPGASSSLKPVPIPPRYQNVATSGLTYTIKRGTNEHNILLSSQ
jgi:hypothetical protein